MVIVTIPPGGVSFESVERGEDFYNITYHDTVNNYTGGGGGGGAGAPAPSSSFGGPVGEVRPSVGTGSAAPSLGLMR